MIPSVFRSGPNRAGIPALGLWRDRVHEAGLEKAAKLVRDAGLRVSSLCRGGFLTASDEAGIAGALEDNKRAVDEAATLGTDALVMVVGGLPEGDVDLAGARERAEAAEGVEPGPDYLGLSFVSPGMVTGLTSCTAPGTTDRTDQVPYTLIGETLGVVDDATTENLRSALSTMAQNLDRGIGCAPRQALEDQAAATTAP